MGKTPWTVYDRDASYRAKGPYHCCATDKDGESVAEWWENTKREALASCQAAVSGAGTAIAATAEDARDEIVVHIHKVAA